MREDSESIRKGDVRGDDMRTQDGTRERERAQERGDDLKEREMAQEGGTGYERERGFEREALREREMVL
jgi:hypothetical protein